MLYFQIFVLLLVIVEQLHQGCYSPCAIELSQTFSTKSTTNGIRRRHLDYTLMDVDTDDKMISPMNDKNETDTEMMDKSITLRNGDKSEFITFVFLLISVAILLMGLLLLSYNKVNSIKMMNQKGENMHNDSVDTVKDQAKDNVKDHETSTSSLERRPSSDDVNAVLGLA